MTGMALVPSDGVGSGVVNLDTLALGTASASASPSGAGGPAASTTAPATRRRRPTTATTAPTATADRRRAAPTATPATAAPTADRGDADDHPDGDARRPPRRRRRGHAADDPDGGPGSRARRPAASGAVTGTIIPLYTAPTNPSWAAVAAAKAAHPAVPVLAVVNPANGPGAAPSADYTAGIARLTAAGVKVIGYVHTLWGARPAPSCKRRWASGTAGTPACPASSSTRWPTRPGTRRTTRASPPTRRGAGSASPSATRAPTRHRATSAPRTSSSSTRTAAFRRWRRSAAGTPATTDSNFGVIPYAVGSLDTSFVQSAKQYVGYIYLQSDNLPNPWDSVPPYLSDAGRLARLRKGPSKGPLYAPRGCTRHSRVTAGAQQSLSFAALQMLGQQRSEVAPEQVVMGTWRQAALQWRDLRPAARWCRDRRRPGRWSGRSCSDRRSLQPRRGCRRTGRRSRRRWRRCSPPGSSRRRSGRPRWRRGCSARVQLSIDPLARSVVQALLVVAASRAGAREPGGDRAVAALAGLDGAVAADRGCSRGRWRRCNRPDSSRRRLRRR